MVTPNNSDVTTPASTVAAVEDYTTFAPDPAPAEVPMPVEVLEPGGSNYNEVILSLFLQKIKMDRSLFNSLPVDWEDPRAHWGLTGSTQEDIRAAADTHYRKMRWEGDRKLAHTEGLAITRQYGLKYLHLKNMRYTVAYSHIPLDPTNPESDWVLTLALAAANEGEPYCRKDGKAFAARRFAQGRRLAFNTSMLPGYEKEEPPIKAAWKKTGIKEAMLAHFIEGLTYASSLFGQRKGPAETDDGTTPEGRAAAKELVRAKRKRIRAAELALEEARNS